MDIPICHCSCQSKLYRRVDQIKFVMWSPSKLLRVPKCLLNSKRTAVCHEHVLKKIKHKDREIKYYRVVMVRHGESEWNQKNLFTGWYDVDLSAKGRMEAQEAGNTLRRKRYCFDVAYTSVLNRAIETLQIILNETNQRGIPVYRTWRLNERHYGALTGLNKRETAEKFGETKVLTWRRSYDIPPPKMEPDHPFFRNIVFDYRYNEDPPRDQFPMAESLKLTLQRTLPYWEGTILPAIRRGRRVLIAAHGNSLRGIVKTLENISDKEIVGVNLPTGIPFQYLLDVQTLKPLPGTGRRFLGDPELVKKATEAVAKQGTVKK